MLPFNHLIEKETFDKNASKEKFGKHMFLLAALGLSAISTHAHAANVALISNIQPPLGNLNPSTTTYTPYVFDVGFGNHSGTATAAFAKIILPANLIDVRLSNGTLAAGCPDASTFTFRPAVTSPTVENQELSSTFSSLGQGVNCNYKLSVTPVSPNSPYNFRADFDPGSTDTQVGSNNSSNNNLTVTAAASPLKVTKTVVSGATAVGGSLVDFVANQTNANQDVEVVYQVEYENLSPSLRLNLGAMGSRWEDWEGRSTSQLGPATSKYADYRCTSSKLAASTICQQLTPTTTDPNQQLDGTEIRPFESAFTNNNWMEPGERITIQYKRIYTAGTCGRAKIYNKAVWDTSRNTTDVVWSAGSDGTADNGDLITVTLPERTPCQWANLYWSADKRLMGVDRGEATPNPMRPSQPALVNISANGDRAVYELEVDLTDPRNAAVPAAFGKPVFSLYDWLWHQNGSPNGFPANAVEVKADWLDCREFSTPSSSRNPADTATPCPADNFPIGAKPFNADLNPFTTVKRELTLMKRTVIRYALTYRTTQPLTCVSNHSKVFNGASFDVMPSTNEMHKFTSHPDDHVEKTAEPLGVFNNLPYCVNLASTTRIEPTTVAALGDTVKATVTLNSNNPVGAIDRLDGVVGTISLGSHFTPTSATCSAANGTTLAYSGGSTVLAALNASTNRTATININNMPPHEVITCTVEGTVAQPGTFGVYTTLGLGTAPVGRIVDAQTSASTPVNVAEGQTTDNPSSAQYMVEGMQVDIRKTTTSTTVKPGDQVRYTIDVANINTLAANGTIVRDPQPAGLSSFSWTCSSFVPAPPAPQPPQIQLCPSVSGTGGINHTITHFPPGASLKYEVTATVASATTATSITNRAQLTLPNPRATCGDNSLGPLCVAEATVTVTPTTPPPPGPTGPTTPTGPGGPGNVNAIPVDAPWALILMASMLAALGWHQQQRKGRKHR